MATKEARVTFDFIFNPREVFASTDHLDKFLQDAFKKKGFQAEVSELAGNSNQRTVHISRLNKLDELIEGKPEETESVVPTEVKELEPERNVFEKKLAEELVSVNINVGVPEVVQPKKTEEPMVNPTDKKPSKEFEKHLKEVLEEKE